MKTKILLLVILMIAATSFIFAQQGNLQPRTVEQRVQSAMEKISTPLNLNKDQVEKTSAIFSEFYTRQNTMREEARSSGNRPDRSVFQKMSAERDEKLKAIFTEDQFKKYKDEVEPSLRPQRRGDGQAATKI